MTDRRSFDKERRKEKISSQIGGNPATNAASVAPRISRCTAIRFFLISGPGTTLGSIFFPLINFLIPARLRETAQSEVVTFALQTLAAVLAAPQPESEKPKRCIWCLLEIGDEPAEPIHAMENDLHAADGLSCTVCHGGIPALGFDEDETAAMDPVKGYVGGPIRTEIPQFCVRRHSDPNFMKQYNPRASTDQLVLYKISAHGTLLARGDTRVATCADYHGVPGILAARNPRSSVYSSNTPMTCGRCHTITDSMCDYMISTCVVDDHKKGVHGIALLEKGNQAVPALND